MDLRLIEGDERGMKERKWPATFTSREKKTCIHHGCGGVILCVGKKRNFFEQSEKGKEKYVDRET